MRSPGLSLAVEKFYFNQGKLTVIGVDEVGRGSLVGPVVAAAVAVTGETRAIKGVIDSKQLTPRQRELADAQLKQTVKRYAIGVINQTMIDQRGIVWATLRAMRQAIRRVLPADYIMIDGLQIPPLPRAGLTPCQAIVHGDQKVYAIAAASIIAKVYRDRWMRQRHMRYPVYGWDHNQGYGTRAHQAAIRKFGPSVLHRLTFVSKLFN